MKISPRELREAQIPSKAFGLNQDVVDSLLERAADTIEGLIEENRQLFEALERLRSETTESSAQAPALPVIEEPAAEVVQEVQMPAVEVMQDSAQLMEKEELINKTLLLAQRTADETLREAKTQAEELVENAKTQANELIEQAKTAAESLTGNAKDEADKNIAAAQEQAQQMVAQAQEQADNLVQEAQAKADSMHAQERESFVALVEELTQQRAQLISDIEILQGFDQEHRSKLLEALEQDLQQLKSRETIDVGSIPELPKVQDIAPPPSVPEQVVAAKTESISDNTFEEPQTFDDVFDVAESQDTFDDIDDEVLVSDDYEADEIIEVPAAGDEPVIEDAFAAFVDSAPSVVAPAGEEPAQVVEPASDGLESSDLSGAFEPNKKARKKSEDLNDDDFFASLREAVNDESPLGPSEDDPEDNGPFKGLFKK